VLPAAADLIGDALSDIVYTSILAEIVALESGAA
jgi:hypothetical protein